MFQWNLHTVFCVPVRKHLPSHWIVMRSKVYKTVTVVLNENKVIINRQMNNKIGCAIRMYSMCVCVCERECEWVGFFAIQLSFQSVWTVSKLSGRSQCIVLYTRNENLTRACNIRSLLLSLRIGSTHENRLFFSNSHSDKCVWLFLRIWGHFCIVMS